MLSIRTNRAGLNSSSYLKLRSNVLTSCAFIVCATVAFYLATSSAKSKSEASSLTAPMEAGYAVNEALSKSIQKGIAHPLALTSGDFDSDGVADVVTGYDMGTGTLLLRRGNKEARFPSTRASIDAIAEGNFAPPFLTGSVSQSRNSLLQPISLGPWWPS